MTKITLDRETFKALASDTRLDILKTLDGKNMGLNEIVKATNLNKATLHEHLGKLHGAGLIKRNERDGHKWVYYKLTWKGESLLHPENTKIVVLFTTTFVALWVGIIQLIWYIKGTVMNLGYTMYSVGDGATMHESAVVLPDFLKVGAFYSSNQNYSGIPPFLQNLFSTGGKQLNFIPINSSGIPLNADLDFVTRNYAPMAVDNGGRFVVDKSQNVIQAVYQNPLYLYIALGCFVVFAVVLCISLWRLWENRTPKI
jgi:DNA-binding transcriptional ArsR family regulator